MEGALNYFQMAINIRENIKMEKLKGKEHILGEIMKYMMENGSLGKKMAMEFGKEFQAIVILGNGKTVRLKVMGFIHGQMEIDMKENGKNV